MSAWEAAGLAPNGFLWFFHSFIFTVCPVEGGSAVRCRGTVHGNVAVQNRWRLLSVSQCRKRPSRVGRLLETADILPRSKMPSLFPLENQRMYDGTTIVEGGLVSSV